MTPNSLLSRPAQVGFAQAGELLSLSGRRRIVHLLPVKAHTQWMKQVSLMPARVHRLRFLQVVTYQQGRFV